jgi:hypothetical protein
MIIKMSGVDNDEKDNIAILIIHSQDKLRCIKYNRSYYIMAKEEDLEKSAYSENDIFIQINITIN